MLHGLDSRLRGNDKFFTVQTKRGAGRTHRPNSGSTHYDATEPARLLTHHAPATLFTRLPTDCFAIAYPRRALPQRQRRVGARQKVHELDSRLRGNDKFSQRTRSAQ